MKTAYEIAIDKLEAKELIPLITDSLGRGWDQPDRAEITLDNSYALMTRKTFNALAEYSCSRPSGVYEGKMWKRHDGAFDEAFKARGGKPTWLLCWYGRSDKPNFVSNNHRKIILVDDDINSVKGD